MHKGISEINRFISVDIYLRHITFIDTFSIYLCFFWFSFSGDTADRPTALHSACHAGYPDVVRILLDNGADFSEPTGLSSDYTIKLLTIAKYIEAREEEVAADKNTPL